MNRRPRSSLKATSLFVLIAMSLADAHSATTGARPLALRSSVNRASFAETFERYPSPFAVLEQLKRIAPAQDTSVAEECRAVTEQSAPLIGTIDPLQGSALEQEPGALFYQYYRRCVRSMVRALFENGHIDSFSIVVLGAPLSQRVQGWAWSSCSDHRLRLAPGDDVVGARCRRYQSDLARNAWVLTNWAEIEPELRRAILERFALYLVGPESVLRSRRYFGARNAFNRELPTYASLIDFLDTSLLDAGGGRMSLMDVYANIAILLRLGPAIRS